MRRGTRARLLATLLGLAVSAGASAEVIRFEVKGTTTAATALAQAGEQVAATFSYDTNTPDKQCYESTTYRWCAYYLFTAHTMAMRVGSHTINTAGLTVTVETYVLNDGPQDTVSIGGYLPSVDGVEYPVGGASLRLMSGPARGNVLGGAELPTEYQVHRFDLAREGFVSTGGVTMDATLLYFQIDSIKEFRGR